MTPPPLFAETLQQIAVSPRRWRGLLKRRSVGESRGMSRYIRNGLAVFLGHIRGFFRREWSDQPDPEDDIREWLFEPANDLTHNVKSAGGRPLAIAAPGEKRHELIVAMTALLGVTSRETLDWIVTRMLASTDPAIHSLARGLKAMWIPARRAVVTALTVTCNWPA